MQWLVTFFTVLQMVLKWVGWVENTAGRKKRSWTKIIKAIQEWNKFRRIQDFYEIRIITFISLGMRHPSILLWIKNIIIKMLSPFQNFQILHYLTKIYVFKSFRQVKMIKGQTWFEIMTNRFVVYAQRSCSSLLSVR